MAHRKLVYFREITNLGGEVILQEEGQERTILISLSLPAPFLPRAPRPLDFLAHLAHLAFVHLG